MERFNNLTMRVKLQILFLLLSIGPLVATGTILFVRTDTTMQQALALSERALELQVLRSLEGLRDVKRSSIESHFQVVEDQISTFSENRMVVEAMADFRRDFVRNRGELRIDKARLEAMRTELARYYEGDFADQYQAKTGKRIDARGLLKALDDDSVALQHAYLQANANPLGEKHRLDRAAQRSAYNELHGVVHPVIRSYLERFGYYDIFLVDVDTGDIVYSVFKELDYTTSLIDGPYARTNFGEAFRRASAARPGDDPVLVDFQRYTPSYEAPASFIASPIFDGDEKVGVAVFQVPVDRITAVMAERSGLGETGETYLVGVDHLMRSNSYHDSVTRSVSASFLDPEAGRVDSAAVTEALAG